jgi:DNA-directed RNA polymerase subunit RPC12/RpoP
MKLKTSELSVHEGTIFFYNAKNDASAPARYKRSVKTPEDIIVLSEGETNAIARCPACGGRDLRPSRSRGVRDAFMLHFQRTPWRCRACGHRFYRRVQTQEAPPPARD